MKYYPHHIGDFDHATRHLSRIERSIYRDMIDVYYDTEKPLPLDTSYLKRKIMATSEEESLAVEQVLQEFFVETPTGWFNSRCDHEIVAYHKNSSQKSIAGKASAAARAARKQQAIDESKANKSSDSDTAAAKPNPPERNAQNNLFSQDDIKKPSRVTGKSLPSDWTLPKTWGEWALSERPDMTETEVRGAANLFKDHWLANANHANSKKSDWEAAWRNWIRRTKTQMSHGGLSAASKRMLGDQAEREFLGTVSTDIIDGEFSRV